MKYIILAPANVQSGGPELSHQLCYKLNSFDKNATMYYCVANTTLPQDVDAIPKFQKYNTNHETSFEEVDCPDNIVIVPEGLASFSFNFKNATVALWWMSVDNLYLPFEDREAALSHLLDIIPLHLVQSYYAYDFLLKKGVNSSSVCYLTDYLADIYKKFVFPPQYRNNTILYNPAKGLDCIAPYIKLHPQYDWRPLYKLTEEEMVLLMQYSKLYIDFGHHPGKDRIPREAASCGCVVITNKAGSAAFFEDVPIDEKYKFEHPAESYDQLTALIDDIFADFASHFSNFSDYRNIIKQDEETFNKEVLNFISIAEQLPPRV